MKVSPKIALTLAILGLVGTGSLAASAHDLPDNSDRPAWVEQAHNAMESGDYAAWKTAHEQRFQEMTSEDRFTKLREFHRLMTEGKTDEARAYAEENDMPMGRGRGHGRHHMMNQEKGASIDNQVAS